MQLNHLSLSLCEPVNLVWFGVLSESLQLTYPCDGNLNVFIAADKRTYVYHYQNVTDKPILHLRGSGVLIPDAEQDEI